ncbi:MBL fold metallo-hydrolase [Mesoplasma lactucae]|uniref:Uncharacterized protein n=1 Tax=Mesoplasma lactucae ATCC 49193 TaxID=81460 RepID=A0A291ISK4_9MOLU|nr:MBL fold metallo-hydrolase [Mesoplasma lactucae]ATG97789.1 hypothetical protein CP520_03570 [Mesoplasma lactucae ATCC 49193]ATZ20433.1 hypothetical protein MLACT_v1c06120 [Mesoplasma lactucae ATCC 49193]MCL8216605.1 putative metallo-hydrolase [Mesoplasma lactucae ATCC 49193]
MIKILTHKQNNKAHAYLVSNDEIKEAVLIDVANEEEAILKYLKDNELTLTNILITHGHATHIKGLDKVIDANPDVKVWIHSDDHELIHDSKKNLSNKTEPWTMEFRKNIKNFTKEKSLTMSGMHVKMKPNPGHSRGSCFYDFSDIKALFTGDYVYINNNEICYGNHKMLQPGTSYIKFRRTLFNMDVRYMAYKIYPGHFDTPITNERLDKLDKDWFKKTKQKRNR